MEAVIRRARDGDEQHIADMLLKLVGQHAGYDPGRFSEFVTRDGASAFYRSRFRSPNAAVVVAEVEGELVGFAYIEFARMDYENLLENAAWLHDLYLETDARSRGIGRQLMAGAKDAAKELGAERLVLSVAAKNASGREFFEKAGFRHTMLEMTLDLK